MQVANGPKDSEAAQTSSIARADRSDRFSRVSSESVVSWDNYHTYMVKDGEVYKQTSKG